MLNKSQYLIKQSEILTSNFSLESSLGKNIFAVDLKLARLLMTGYVVVNIDVYETFFSFVAYSLIFSDKLAMLTIYF